MADNTNRADQLANVMDAVTDSVLEMSDEEILAEVREQGEDPAQLALQVKQGLFAAIKSYKQRHLNAARTGYDRESRARHQARAVLPPSAAERRQLLAQVYAHKPELLTLQYRDFDRLTDLDVESLLAEFDELGVLNELLKSKDE